MALDATGRVLPLLDQRRFWAFRRMVSREDVGRHAKPPGSLMSDGTSVMASDSRKID
jgi:hypothetical protein